MLSLLNTSSIVTHLSLICIFKPLRKKISGLMNQSIFAYINKKVSKLKFINSCHKKEIKTEKFEAAGITFFVFSRRILRYKRFN